MAKDGRDAEVDKGVALAGERRREAQDFIRGGGDFGVEGPEASVAGIEGDGSTVDEDNDETERDGSCGVDWGEEDEDGGGIAARSADSSVDVDNVDADAVISGNVIGLSTMVSAARWASDDPGNNAFDLVILVFIPSSNATSIPSPITIVRRFSLFSIEIGGKLKPTGGFTFGPKLMGSASTGFGGRTRRCCFGRRPVGTCE